MRFDKPYGAIPCTSITDTAGSNSSTPANLALAVTAKHTQNTDTGTTSATFQLESSSSGPKLKNSSGAVAIRNAADGADANATCATITASSEVVGPKAKITAEGGYAVLLTNKTGHTSIKGEIVACDTSAANAVMLPGENGLFPMGVIYNGGVLADAEVWVVVKGRCQVALKDETASTQGQWIGTCAQDGRVTCVADPSAIRAQGCGRCCETVSAGAEGVLVLCYAMVNFN